MTEFTTARVAMRPFAPADLDAFIGLHGDTAVMAHLHGGVETVEQARRTFRHYGASWARFGIGVWALFDRTDGTLIGECGFRCRDDGQGFGIRYALLPRRWGRGLASEATAAAIAHAFGTADMKRIVGVAQLANRASCRVMERAGMSLERVVERPDRQLGFYVLMRRDWLARLTVPAGPGFPADPVDRSG
jgi:RimJ/RimL family protein N-acetyltransferase